jgi:hypothetical protein
MSFLKNLKSKPSTGVLKEYLHKNLAGFQKARSRKNIHASSVTKTDIEYCPREQGIMDILGLKDKDEFIGTSLNYTFQYGRWAESAVQNEWMADIAFGDWKCNVCGEVHSARMKPKKCGCGHSNFSYKEMRVLDPSGMSGGVDLFVKFPHKKKLTLLEIKTMDKDQFKTLLAPLAEHRTRTNLYLNAIERSSEDWAHKVNTKSAIILYICKGFGFKDEEVKQYGDAPFSPFKEFEINSNLDTVQVYFDKAQQLTDFRTNVAPLPKGVCETLTCKRAKTCRVSSQCFTGEYDGAFFDSLKETHLEGM